MDRTNRVWWPQRRQPTPALPFWRGLVVSVLLSMLTLATCGAWLVSDSDVDAWSHRIAAEARP